MKTEVPRSNWYLYPILMLVSFGLAYAFVTRNDGEGALGLAAAGKLPASIDSTRADAKPQESVRNQATPMSAQAESQQVSRAEAMTAASQEAVSAVDPEQRRAALRQIAALTVADGQVDGSLIGVMGNALSDPEWRVRFQAVVELAKAARLSSDKRQFAELLGRAAQDPHNSVSARSRIELRALGLSQP